MCIVVNNCRDCFSWQWRTLVKSSQTEYFSIEMFGGRLVVSLKTRTPVVSRSVYNLRKKHVVLNWHMELLLILC